VASHAKGYQALPLLLFCHHHAVGESGNEAINHVQLCNTKYELRTTNYELVYSEHLMKNNVFHSCLV